MNGEHDIWAKRNCSAQYISFLQQAVAAKAIVKQLIQPLGSTTNTTTTATNILGGCKLAAVEHSERSCRQYFKM